MINNEQRAHDLATAMLDTMMEAEFVAAKRSSTVDSLNITLFDKYLEFYSSFLSKCENHFDK